MATSWNRVSVLDGKLRKAHYSLLNLLQPTKIILQTQYFFLDYIHNLKLRGIKHYGRPHKLYEGVLIGSKVITEPR